MNIFDKINELKLPRGEYVVVGGGVLVALSLLDWDDDIDMTVTPGILEGLKKGGWREDSWQGKPVFKRDVYDIGIGFYIWDLNDLLEDAIWIHDIPFMSLEKLLEWKKQMGREKDIHHIALIERYQQQTGK